MSTSERVTCPECGYQRVCRPTRKTDVCSECRAAHESGGVPSFSLSGGAWRFDPFKRIQVWVPGSEPAVDVNDAPTVEPESPAKKRIRYHTKTCADCSKLIDNRSTRCQECHTDALNQNGTRPPIFNPRRLHDPIDELKVQRVLDGQFVKCTRPERLEVLVRWSALGRSDGSLIKLTGWNVPRDRKYLISLNEKDAAA